jgi:hypothetical protein
MYISPTYSDIQTLSAQSRDYNQVLEQAKEVATKRDQAVASYNAISTDDLSRLAKIVPVSFSSVTFVNYLSAIAGKYGLVVDKMQIDEQNSGNGQVVVPNANSYQTKNVTFSVSGSYDSLVGLLKDLESGLYLVDVTGLTLKRNSAPGKSLTFEFDVTLNTYSLN